MIVINKNVVTDQYLSSKISTNPETVPVKGGSGY
jgi:hypothetical protein